MSGKEELITKVVENEEDMFSKVKNMGGRAPCQDDMVTFEAMRSSQFMAWSKEALESYLNDLEEAKKVRRNLVSEKYARMMKSTSLLEYDRIKHLLPLLDMEIPPLINRIIEIELEWIEQLHRKFPYVMGKGRPICSLQDSKFATSLETYLRGELETYSKKTIELYYKDILDKKSKNINREEIIYESMMKKCGLNSLEEANERIKVASESTPKI